jgi:branched-chain amino acid transport system substrate-binding protein
MEKQKAKKTLVGLLVILLISSAFLLISLTGNAVEQDTIKVGGIFALTGGWAVGGGTEANFVKIAVDEINANGGVNGKQLELILEDGKCSATEAVNSFKKLTEVDNVDIIFGPSCSPTSAVVVPMSSNKGKLIFAATTTTKNIFDKYNFAFRTSPSSEKQAGITANRLLNLYDKKNVVVITETTNFAKGWADDFSDQYRSIGGKILLKEEFNPGTMDFKTSLSKMKELKPDAIFISAQKPGTAAEIINEMIELGMAEDIQITGNPVTIGSSVVGATDGKLPSDAFTIVPYLENNELLNKYVGRYGSEPGFNFFLTAASYDSVYIVKEALEVCGENNACINSYIKGLNDWQGEVSTWNFNEFGDPILPDESFAELKVIAGQSKFVQIKEDL